MIFVKIKLIHDTIKNEFALINKQNKTIQLLGPVCASIINWPQNVTEFIRSLGEFKSNWDSKGSFGSSWVEND